jgi:hypothetical protein
MWQSLRVSMLAGLALAGTAAASDEVLLTALDDTAYDLTRDGVVQLLCTNPGDGRLFLSRAIALDLPGVSGDFDVLLAARHAVTNRGAERDCAVRGVDPLQGAVGRIMTSTPELGERGDFEQDWAILRTVGRLPEGTPRIPAAVYYGEESGEVSLLVRAVEYDPCTITVPPANLANVSLLFHDCRSRPGLSGSPLLTMIDGEPHVVAVHVGEYLMLDETDARYSVARRLSGEFLIALETFIKEEAAR